MFIGSVVGVIICAIAGILNGGSVAWMALCGAFYVGTLLTDKKGKT